MLSRLRESRLRAPSGEITQPITFLGLLSGIQLKKQSEAKSLAIFQAKITLRKFGYIRSLDSRNLVNYKTPHLVQFLGAVSEVGSLPVLELALGPVVGEGAGELLLAAALVGRRAHSHLSTAIYVNY